MTDIETMKDLSTCKDDWLKDAAKSADFTDDDTLLITIHRGAKQIGGSITEISMGRTAVLVDCGSELPGSQGSVRDEDIIKKIFCNRRRYTDHHLSSVLFTHYHGDHVGLMDRIPTDIPIYMDSATHDFEDVAQTHREYCHAGNAVKWQRAYSHLYSRETPYHWGYEHHSFFC